LTLGLKTGNHHTLLCDGSLVYVVHMNGGLKTDAMRFFMGLGC